MTDDLGFAVSFSTGRRIDLDEVRRRGEALMPDGEHAWIITVVYAIADPEQAMDDMHLDDKNFVGIAPISCLLCNVKYRKEIRHHKCPQSPNG